MIFIGLSPYFGRGDAPANPLSKCRSPKSDLMKLKQEENKISYIVAYLPFICVPYFLPNQGAYLQLQFC